MRACDVDDESAADAVDPAADNGSGGSSSTSSIFEKTSRGAQGMSYTGSSIEAKAQPDDDRTGAATASPIGHNCTSTQTLSQSEGARFWSLAYVSIAAICMQCVHMLTVNLRNEFRF